MTPESQIEFECQHGPDECFGNKVQGCMLSRIADQDTVSNITNAILSRANRTFSVYNLSKSNMFHVKW